MPLDSTRTDSGWLTHWALGKAEWRLEVVFLERGPADSGILVIPPDDPIGVPGRHATLAGYLDPNRHATLDGVTFRVCSPSGEWLARVLAPGIIKGRPPIPKLNTTAACLRACCRRRNSQPFGILRLAGWLRDSSAAHVESLCEWGSEG